ncbi:MAG: hypothetical protein JST92_12410 [Deltaproteobacteria bacterium]|nr:hypothetical protein [Deltaproteobacteria bacterium]
MRPAGSSARSSWTAPAPVLAILALWMLIAVPLVAAHGLGPRADANRLSAAAPEQKAQPVQQPQPPEDRTNERQQPRPRPLPRQLRGLVPEFGPRPPPKRVAA